MSDPFTSREMVLIALYEARQYVSKVSEATIHKDADYADFELLELLETAIERLGIAFNIEGAGGGS